MLFRFRIFIPNKNPIVLVPNFSKIRHNFPSVKNMARTPKIKTIKMAKILAIITRVITPQILGDNPASPSPPQTNLSPPQIPPHPSCKIFSKLAKVNKILAATEVAVEAEIEVVEVVVEVVEAEAEVEEAEEVLARKINRRKQLLQQPPPLPPQLKKNRLRKKNFLKINKTRPIWPMIKRGSLFT